MFPPGRFKHTGHKYASGKQKMKVPETPDMPKRKRGRPRKVVAVAVEPQNPASTSEKAGPPLMDSADKPTGKAAKVSAEEREKSRVIAALKLEAETVRKMEGIILWLRNWVTENILPITSDLCKRSLTEKERKRIFDQCHKLEVTQLESYVDGISAEHPEYLMEGTANLLPQKCVPLMHQIGMEVSRIAEAMNKIQEEVDHL